MFVDYVQSLYPGCVFLLTNFFCVFVFVFPFSNAVVCIKTLRTEMFSFSFSEFLNSNEVDQTLAMIPVNYIDMQGGKRSLDVFPVL